MRGSVKALLAALASIAIVGALTWAFLGERRERVLAAIEPLFAAVQEPTAPAGSASEQSRADSSDDDGSREHDATRGEGPPGVSLSVDKQSYSGIETTPLQRVTHRPEIKAFGQVVDIEGLLELRGRYRAVEAERAVHKAAVAASRREYERVRRLNKQGNIVSSGRMEEAKARWQADKTRVRAAEAKLQSLRDQAIQAWGPTLTSMAFSESSQGFERLVAREDVLLRLTLPRDETLPQVTDAAHVDANGQRDGAREASLVSSSPQASALSQGETYFFRASAQGLRTGIRVTGWIPRARAPVSGVRLPAAATVWHAGQPWAYVQVDDRHFVRRRVAERLALGGDRFVREGFEPGERVVIQGGQMLLSEEFREQIPEEDPGDDD